MAEVTQEQFIDAVVFTVALHTFQVLKPEDPFAAEGVTLFKRFRPSIYEGVERFFGPLMDEPTYTRANSAYRLMINNRNGQPELYRRGLEAVLDILNSRPADVRETFSSSTLGVRAVMQLARALTSDNGSEILMEIAKIPAVSRARVMRNWIKEACERAGVSPSEVEETLVDASEGRHLGEQLQKVDDQIAAVGTMTEDGVDLKAEKAEIVKAIEQVARQSPSPEVVVAAVATAQTTNTAQAPKTSQGLSPDQQAAVESTGKLLFAAGAGSGKTRVLAKKVVYHLEKGVPASSIVATSFSRKSAAELMKRVRDYGGEIPKGMDGGFGTTHSVAAKLLRDYGGGNALDSMSTYLAKDLIRLAMEQVKMSAAPPGDPEVVSLIPQLQASPTNDGSNTPLSFLQALDAASKKRLAPFHQTFINSFFDPNDRWYAQTMRATRNFTDPRGLSDKQREILKKIFDIAGVSYSPTTDPVLNGSQKRASDVQDAPVANIRMIHVAAGNQADTEGYKAKYPTSFTTPARQWFNIGDDLTESSGKEKKPIPPAVFKNAITKYKGQLISPTEAWAKDKSPQAAVYGAYEWLRGPQGDPAFIGKGDFDDLLVSAVRMMVKSPDALKRIQKQFRVMLIDEAQDLNKTQHVLFGLMAGVVDPSKVHRISQAKKIKEVFWDDSRVSADVYALIGDDFQCVDQDALLTTPEGPVRLGDIKPGDQVQAYRNSNVEFQTVRHVARSSWEYGYKITTESGRTLTMSPNHKLWATEPQTREGQMAVYLMFRKDMGFRIGITNKGKIGHEGEFYNSYGGRAFSEKAERMWILDMPTGREDALQSELDMSLTYGIPTLVFCGETRGLNQSRIDAIFKKHGDNGMKLLEDRHLSFDFPHWMSQSYTKHGRNRHTIQFNAHGKHGSNVTMEWEGDKFDDVLSDVKVVPVGNRRRLRRWFNNYREGLAFTLDIAKRTGANVSYRLSTPEGVLRETTASGLFVGMSVPVMDEEDRVVHEEIVSIETVKGVFVDIDVDDASTFFANGVLTSNSIYGFRSADPKQFVDLSDLVQDGAGFKTHLLTTNYRSGKEIVDLGMRLISHNDDQVPKVCEANPNRSSKGEVSVVKFAPVEGGRMTEVAAWVADKIIEDKDNDDFGHKGYDSYGVAVRSNAEAYLYGLEMLKRGIPFRSKANFFKNKTTQAVLAWLTIADEGVGGSEKRINEAVLLAKEFPSSKLGPKFVENLQQMATGNYIDWLGQNWKQVFGSRGAWAEKVLDFVGNLKAIRALSGQGSQLVFESILDLQGADGKTLKETLVDRVKDDEEMLAELRSNSEDGSIDEHALTEAALAPIMPVMSILEARADLKESMKYVRQLQAANDKLAAEDDPDGKGYNEPAVTINTIHGWKGLEVERMFVPFVGGSFPRLDATKEDLAEERRIGYTALTRAEERLYVLNVPKVFGGEKKRTVVESQFIGEMCLGRTPPPKEIVDQDVQDALGMSLGDVDLDGVEDLP